VPKALLTLSLGLATALPAGRAIAQHRTTPVAIVDAFSFSAKAVEAHARLRATMEEVLAAEGWLVAQGPDIADCGTTGECLAKIARDNGVGYVLRVSGQRKREYGYDVSLDLFSLVTGHVRGAVSSCDMCDSQRMSEGAGKAAVDLLAKTVEEEAQVKEEAKRTAPPPVVVATRVPSPPPVPSPAPPREPRASWIPWPMIGVGALGVAYGAWALYKNGQSSGSAHPGPATSYGPEYGRDVYSAKGLGIGTLVGGGVVLLTGVIWVAVTPSGSAALSAAPHHVALSLRF
jgi:hypothetical protein